MSQFEPQVLSAQTPFAYSATGGPHAAPPPFFHHPYYSMSTPHMAMINEEKQKLEESLKFEKEKCFDLEIELKRTQAQAQAAEQ